MSFTLKRATDELLNTPEQPRYTGSAKCPCCGVRSSVHGIVQDVAGTKQFIGQMVAPQARRHAAHFGGLFADKQQLKAGADAFFDDALPEVR